MLNKPLANTSALIILIAGLVYAPVFTVVFVAGIGAIFLAGLLFTGRSVALGVIIFLIGAAALIYSMSLCLRR